MKRIATAITILTLILSLTLTPALAEETFTLHQGTTFGMSLNDVLLTEKTAGNELEIMTPGDYQQWPIGGAWSTNETVYYGGCEAVGGLFGLINYLFDGTGGVSAFAYSKTTVKDEVDLTELIGALTDKYGEPVAESMDDFKDIGLGWDAIESINNSTTLVTEQRLTSSELHQWLYPYAGGCVDIQLVKFTLNYSGLLDTNCAMLSYTLRTPQEYEMFINGPAEQPQQGSIEDDI